MRLIIPADLLKARRKKPVEGQLSLFGVPAPKPAPKAPAPKPKRSAGGRGGGSGRGKAAPGETRQWADGTYQKQADGTWKKVSDNGRKETKGAGGAVPGVLGASGRREDARGPDRPSGGGKEKRAREVAEEIKSEDPTPVTPETALPDGRPLVIKPPSERSPAIAIYPDLWPQDDEIPPIPGHIARFPNPAELRTSSGKVTGMISELFSHQVDGVRRIMYAWQNGNGALLQDSAGLGKLQPVDTPVMTPNGWRPIGEIEVGDEVISSSGKPASVIAVKPQGIKKIYRVTFSDGSSTEAGPEHLWTVRYRCGGKRFQDLTLTTEMLRNREPLAMKWPNGRRTQLTLDGLRLYLPMLSGPVEFKPGKALPIEPYLTGALIANGYLSSPTPSLTTNSNDWSEVKERVKGWSSEHYHPGCARVTFPGTGKIIRELSLNVPSRDKFIPRIYLEASPDDRVALFQGLMDADGSISKERNRITYHTTSKQLAKDVQELVEGLGGVASVRAYDRTAEDKPIEYQVRVRPPSWAPPFSVRRKLDRYNPGIHASPLRTVTSVEYSRDAEAVCIAVDALDQLYATEHAILTHNTNTAIAALVANGGKRNLIVVPVAGKEGLKAQWIGEHAAGLYGIDVKGAKVRTTKTGKQAVDFVADELSSTEPGTYIVSYDELYETERDEKGEVVRNEKGKPKKRLRKSLFDGKWDAIAFDESHTMQSRGKLLSDAGKAIQERADKVLYMSATPFTNISDMHYLTKLGLFDSSDEGFAKWAEQAGATVKGQKINNPSSHLPMAAIAATLHANGLSIKREISLEGVSSKFDQLKQAKLTDEQAKAFETADKIIDMASAAIPKEYLKALYIGWIRQYWEICKVDRAVELGRKALDSGKQVAFFTSYKSADHAHLRAIPRMLSKRAARLSMSDSPYQQRRAEELAQLAEDIGEVVDTLPAGDSAVKRLVDAFGGGGSVAEVHGDSKKKPAQEQASYQSGEKRVFVATMSKGGTGISLHDTTGERPRVQINLSLPWSAREFNQVAGRSHRLGSKSDTEMYWMVGEDDSEARNGAKVAKRLQSMGSLTAGNPELTVDAGQLLAWEFEGASQISDDENDIIAALVEADASPEEADDGRLEGTADAEHAQAARDHFREYAERIRAGGDVIKERYKEAQDRKKQLAFRESRRAAEQLRQRHGLAIHWRSYAGAWEIDRADLTDYQAKLLKKKAIDGRAVTYGGREIVAFRIKPDGLRALSVELGSSDLKVDIPSVSEHLDPSKRGEAEKAVDELGEKGLRARFWGHSGDGQPVYLVTGRTWDNKAALGAVGRFARIDNEKGYLVAESYLPAVVENMKKLGNWGEEFVTHPAPYRDRPGPDKPAQHQKRTHLAKSRRLVIRAT